MASLTDSGGDVYFTASRATLCSVALEEDAAAGALRPAAAHPGVGQA